MNHYVFTTSNIRNEYIELLLREDVNSYLERYETILTEKGLDSHYIEHFKNKCLDIYEKYRQTQEKNTSKFTLGRSYRYFSIFAMILQNPERFEPLFSNHYFPFSKLCTYFSTETINKFLYDDDYHHRFVAMFPVLLTIKKISLKATQLFSQFLEHGYKNIINLSEMEDAKAIQRAAQFLYSNCNPFYKLSPEEILDFAEEIHQGTLDRLLASCSLQLLAGKKRSLDELLTM